MPSFGSRTSLCWAKITPSSPTGEFDSTVERLVPFFQKRQISGTPSGVQSLFGLHRRSPPAPTSGYSLSPLRGAGRHRHGSASGLHHSPLPSPFPKSSNLAHSAIKSR